MLIPYCQKLTKRNDVLVERALPKKGDLDLTIGKKVEPFTRLGIAKVSYGKLPIEQNLRIVKGRSGNSFFYTGEKIGTLGGKKLIAPFDGTLKVEGNGYVFEQEERDFWLLSGVWGDVIDSVDKRSVLLRTQAMDIHLAVCTGKSCDGELVVFPNPSEILEMQYLERYSKENSGKIVYTGNHVSAAIVEKAASLRIVGLLAGSADREAFTLAKQKGIFLGSISGFGKIPTPDFIYDILKDISSRYVFLYPDEGVLRIPVSSQFKPEELSPINYTGTLKEVEEGLRVQVLEDPYFGWLGTIAKGFVNTNYTEDLEILVILDEVTDPVKIRVQNLLAI